MEGAPREDAPRNDATPFVLEHGRSVFEFYGDAANARASQAFDELMLQLSTSDGESGNMTSGEAFSSTVQRFWRRVRILVRSV
eukprot:g33574.t1